MYCSVYCPGKHFPSDSKDAVHFGWSAIVETSCTNMWPLRSSPLVASNAVAAQVAASLLLAASSEVQGSRLSGEGWLYCRYNVLFPGILDSPVAAASRREDEDVALVGSIVSRGGPEAAGSEGSKSNALIAQSTWKRDQVEGKSGHVGWV